MNRVNILLAAVGVRPNVGHVGRALVTFSPFPGGEVNTLLLLVASTIGATVTPWMLFFQQSAIADKGLTTHDIRFGRVDTVVGAALAALAALATIIATAPLFAHGMAAGNFEAAEFAQTSPEPDPSELWTDVLK